jgi:vacuolar-type H+-ATPase subunit I/STV1
MLAFPLLAVLASEVLTDPVEIVKRLAAADRKNREIARQYTYIERSEEREYDSRGKLKKTKSETKDVLYLFGRRYEKLVERNGQPLSGKERAKEEEKLRKESEKRQRESEKDRDRLANEQRKQSEQLRELIDEIVKAYSLKLEGRESIDARPVYRVSAEPRREYNRKLPPYSFLKNLRGTMWIDAEDFQLVKVQAEVTDSFSFGLILARMARGSTLRFEQTRVNGEVWLPKLAAAKIDGRFLVDRFRGESTTAWRGYRKFQTDSRVVSAAELPQP